MSKTRINNSGELAKREVLRQRKQFQTNKPSRGCWNSVKIALAAIPALFKRGEAIHVNQPVCVWGRDGSSAYTGSHEGPRVRPGGIRVRSDAFYAWSDCYSVLYWDPCRELPDYTKSDKFLGYAHLDAFPAPTVYAGFDATQEELDTQNSISLWRWRGNRERECFPDRVSDGQTTKPPTTTTNITNATSSASPAIDSQIAPVHDDSAIAAGVLFGLGVPAILGAVGLTLAAYKCYKDYRAYKVVPATMEFHKTEEGRSHVQGFIPENDNPITLHSRSITPSPSGSLSEQFQAS